MVSARLQDICARFSHPLNRLPRPLQNHHNTLYGFERLLIVAVHVLSRHLIRALLTVTFCWLPLVCVDSPYLLCWLLNDTGASTLGALRPAPVVSRASQRDRPMKRFRSPQCCEEGRGESEDVSEAHAFKTSAKPFHSNTLLYVPFSKSECIAAQTPSMVRAQTLSARRTGVTISTGSVMCKSLVPAIQ